MTINQKNKFNSNINNSHESKTPIFNAQTSNTSLFDTHCHINLIVKEKFDIKLSKQELENSTVISQEAQEANVSYILNVGTSLIECINCIDLAKYNKNMFCAVGIHPCDVTADWRQDLEQIKKFLKNKEENKIICIGECGLDLYHRQDTINMQIDLLRAQIELALELNLPISMHMRSATDQMHKMLQEYSGNGLAGIMHCFPEGREFADYVTAYGFLIGIGGPVTYPKNNTLRETVAHIPLDKIVLETDAPFLAPQSMRGKQNHPKYLPEIATKIAEIKNVNLQEVAQATTNNAINLFKI